MFFLFIIDVIASVTFRVIVNIGTWIVYKSGNGIYYMYKNIKPDNNVEYVTITSDEYNNLIKNNNDDYCITLKKDDYNKLTNNNQL